MSDVVFSGERKCVKRSRQRIKDNNDKLWQMHAEMGGKRNSSRASDERVVRAIRYVCRWFAKSTAKEIIGKILSQNAR